MARQNQRRGGGPPPAKQPSTGSRQRTTSPTPPVSGGSSPSHPHNSRPVSGQGDREPTGPVQRLKSPSVLECVLQPLDHKVREYEQHMRREQEEIKRLDDELRVLQARRAEAEGRFDDAKAKHDEYRRQYNDVERAMSGELGMSPPRDMQHQQQRPATMQGAGPMSQNRPMSARRYGDDVDGEDFDEDDEDFAVPPFGPGRRINSQQSFSRASQKTGGKERFRFSSLFGSGR
ncbi:hypothetical protein F4808DRAFT_408509 [Astrocystis sublimbata]|nr:hypothetical protein F4808DRAFT_408509 [Astrocystis sublimbata]